MRYRKLQLDVRREYAKIQKSILGPYLSQKVGFCVKKKVFGDEESKLGV